MPEVKLDSISERSRDLPERICDVIKPWSDLSPERLALVETSGTWTYGRLASAVSDTERWLLASGVRPGDRVMIVCENCRAFVAILLALAALDAWPVLVNARLTAREIDEIRDHCGARRVIYTTAVSSHAREHAKRHGAVVGEAVGLGPLGIGPLNEQVVPEAIDTDSANRVAALIYTSGTTGQPKGVMLLTGTCCSWRRFSEDTRTDSGGSLLRRSADVSCCRPFGRVIGRAVEWRNALFVAAL